MVDKLRRFVMVTLRDDNKLKVFTVRIRTDITYERASELIDFDEREVDEYQPGVYIIRNLTISRKLTINLCDFKTKDL